MKVRIPKMSIGARVGVTALASSALLGAVLVSMHNLTPSPKMILTSGNDFTITGQLSSTPSPAITPDAFYPGAQRYFVLTVHNPLTAAITVTSLGVAVAQDSSSTPLPPECDPSNLSLPGNTPESLPVPAGGTASAWLPVSMIDSGADQDGCQGATFYFNYSGVAQYVEVYNTSTALTAQPANPSLVGQSVTYTATVSPVTGSNQDPAPSAPTGTVTFDDGSNVICLNVPVTLHPDNTSTAICSPPAYVTSGSHKVSAIYADNTGGTSGTGDGNFVGSTSPLWTQVVNPAPTSVTLLSSPNPSVFGQSVTLTANVSPTLTPQPPNPTPAGGTVSFYRGDPAAAHTLIGTGTVAAGSAIVKTTALPGGTDQLYAVYSGDGNYTGSASQSITQVVGFTTGCLTGTFNGGYTVKAGQSICFASGSTINGGITVQSGGALSITGSTVNGGLTTTGATALQVCHTAVNGTLGISSSTGFVAVGDGGDEAAPACGGNNLNGTTTLSGNTGGFEFGGNLVSGGVTFTGNKSTSTGEDGAEVEGNRIGGFLSCATTNSPALNDGGQKNVVSGTKSGQCSAVGF